MQIWERKFPLTEVAQAADIKKDTLQNWAKRENTLVGNMAPSGGGRGSEREFSFNGLMEIAVAAEANKMIHDVGRVTLAAREFSHFGEGPQGFTGDNLDLSEARFPGLPFYTGRTLLIIYQGGSSLQRVDSGATFSEVINRVPYSVSKGILCFVDCGEVFDRVVTRLGEDPRDVIRAAHNLENNKTS